MELINLITGQPAAMAFGIICLYLYSKNNVEFIKWKREIIEGIRAERKEWLDSLRESNRQLMEMQRNSVEAQGKSQHELHALRGILQRWEFVFEKAFRAGGGPPGEPPR